MDRVGSAATRAKQKYNTANYDRLYSYVPKGRKKIYKEAADAAGLSLNDYLIKALDEKVEREEKDRD